MKKATKNYFLLSCMAISSFNYSDAQSQTVKRVDPGKAGMHASLVEYNLGSAPKFEKGKIPVIADNGNIENIENMILLNVQKDELGFEHYRYQQTYKGIPIENAIIVVHVKDGKVLFENGKLIKTFPEKLSAQPLVNSQMAIKSALNNIKAKSYAWENQLREAQLKKDKNDNKATYYPKGDLVWYSTDGGIEPSKLKLVYKLDVLATEPQSHNIVYIDANNGNILYNNEIGIRGDMPSIQVAQTQYSGQQQITTEFERFDMQKGEFVNNRLLDMTRGNGIHTLKGNDVSSEYDPLFNEGVVTDAAALAKAKEYTNPQLTWNNVNGDKDEYATDAHWGAEKTYDYYKSKFNFTNIGSNNNPLRIYVNVNMYNYQFSMRYPQGGYGGAFQKPKKPLQGIALWNSTQNAILLENNSYSSRLPRTSLDIIAHEITHSVTENTSHLNSTNESGALDEGFGDIFGACAQRFANKSWPIVWSHGVETGNPALRTLYNPQIKKMPSTYKGKFWYTMSDPNNIFQQDTFVHNNSTILSYWFYLLTDGGGGINDNGCAYSVQGIGMEKAERIAFYTNVYFLTNTSDFAETQRISTLVAQLLYGYGSNEMMQTINAWQAVGLSAPNYFYNAYSYCPGELIKVNYSGFCVDPGNLYILQISDANGSFTNATNLTTLQSGAGTGSLSGTTPIHFPSGKNYKLRIVTTAPFSISEVNKSSIEIKNNGLEPMITASSNSICNLPGYTSSTLTAFSTDPKDFFVWSPTGEMKQQITVNKAGTYSVSVLHSNSNGCWNASNKTINQCVSKCLFCTETDRVGEKNNIANTGNAIFYPNPVTNGKATVLVNIKQGLIGNNEKVTLSLYDITGKEIASYGIQNRGNTLQGEINTVGLAKGTYMYSISTGAIRNITKGKVVIQ